MNVEALEEPERTIVEVLRSRSLTHEQKAARLLRLVESEPARPARIDAGDWQLAGSVRMSPVPERWVDVNGWNDEHGLGLNIIVQHPENPELVKRVSVYFPIRVDGDGDLLVGPAQAVEKP